MTTKLEEVFDDLFEDLAQTIADKVAAQMKEWIVDQAVKAKMLELKPAPAMSKEWAAVIELAVAHREAPDVIEGVAKFCEEADIDFIEHGASAILNFLHYRVPLYSISTPSGDVIMSNPLNKKVHTNG